MRSQSNFISENIIILDDDAFLKFNLTYAAPGYTSYLHTCSHDQPKNQYILRYSGVSRDSEFNCSNPIK